MLGAAGVASLRDVKHLDEERAENARVRDFTLQAFKDLGFDGVDAHTNCIVIDLERPAKEFRDGCAALKMNVTDEQGAILPGVTVLVTNEDTGVLREVVIEDSGAFFVSQILPGPYKIRASLEGFAPYDRSGLVVRVGNTLTVDRASRSAP